MLLIISRVDDTKCAFSADGSAFVDHAISILIPDISGLDRIVCDGRRFTIADTEFQVIATPGHARSSICFYVPAAGGSANGILWTGDTMLTGGCGRLLECDAQTMWDSLRKLSALPDDTLVYCGHDYAEEDYEFASGIEPDNEAVRQRLDEIRAATAAGKYTVPDPSPDSDTVTRSPLASV